VCACNISRCVVAVVVRGRTTTTYIHLFLPFTWQNAAVCFNEQRFKSKRKEGSIRIRRSSSCCCCYCRGCNRRITGAVHNNSNNNFSISHPSKKLNGFRRRGGGAIIISETRAKQQRQKRGTSQSVQRSSSRATRGRKTTTVYAHRMGVFSSLYFFEFQNSKKGERGRGEIM